MRVDWEARAIAERHPTVVLIAGNTYRCTACPTSMTAAAIRRFGHECRPEDVERARRRHEALMDPLGPASTRGKTDDGDPIAGQDQLDAHLRDLLAGHGLSAARRVSIEQEHFEGHDAPSLMAGLLMVAQEVQTRGRLLCLVAMPVAGGAVYQFVEVERP